MLGVSTVTANRALQLLAKREILYRRQRHGTFVAQSVAVRPDPLSTSIVHLLVHENFVKSEGVLADGVVLGIQEKLPQAEMNFNFLPTGDADRQTQRLVSGAQRSQDSEYFVLVRAPLKVQRLFEASGLPTVIYGSSFPSVTSLPSIDRDHYQAGRLAASRLIRHGFHRLTVVTREVSLPGDYRMLDGVRDEMSGAGLPVNAICWRPLPSDPESTRYAVADLLRARKEPQGFICRSRLQADGAAMAVAESGQHSGSEIGVILLDAYHATSKASPNYPYLLAAMLPETVGRHIGQMLLSRENDSRTVPSHEIIQLELREPIQSSP
jgi:DNA-binding LacI/PurR family transcriptional regulator